MEARTACARPACGMGSDSCGCLGCDRNTLAKVGIPVVRPYIAKANASMAVFSAGITLSAIHFTLNWQAILGSIMKMVMMPAVILVLGLLFKMDPENLKMLVVAGALPPAFSGIIIADEYDTYVATGTSSLTLSVLLFVGFCPLWLWLTDFAIKAF